MNGLVAVVKRVNTETKHLKRPGRAFGSRATTLEVGQRTRQVMLATLEVRAPLHGRCKLEARIGNPRLRVRLGLARTRALGRNLLELPTKVRRVLLGITCGLAVLFNERTSVRCLLRGICTALCDLSLLGGGLVSLGLESPDLGRHRRVLAAQACDLALGARALVTCIGQLALGICKGVLGRTVGLLELLHAVVQSTNPALALECAALGANLDANNDSAVGKHGNALGGHVGKMRQFRMGLYCLSRALNKANVAQERLEESLCPLVATDALEKRRARSSVCRSGTALPQLYNRRATRGLSHTNGNVGKPLSILQAINDQCRKVIAQKTLNKLVELLGHLNQVGQAALNELNASVRGCERRGEATRVLALLVDTLECRERCASLAQLFARALLVLASITQGLLHRANGVLGLTGRALCLRELVCEGVATLLAVRERFLSSRQGLGNLRQSALEHLVLELGVRDLVLELCVGKRLLISLTLALTLLIGELRISVAELTS